MDIDFACLWIPRQARDDMLIFHVLLILASARRIKGMDWKVPEDIAINGESDSCDQGEANTIEFVFSNTMGKATLDGSNENAGATCDPVCTGDTTCQNGSCQCPNGMILYGYNLCTETTTGECTYNSDCINISKCQGKKCFCKIDVDVDAVNGNCAVLPQMETIIVSGKNFYRIKNQSDRFNTTYLGYRNFCGALNKKTVKASDLGCFPTELDLADTNADQTACDNWSEVYKLGWRWYIIDGPIASFCPTEYDFRNVDQGSDIGHHEPFCTD